MQEDIHKMRQRHEAEIQELQSKCKHKNHRRMPFMWALGHYGNDVEVCDFCGKILKHYKDRSPIF